MREPTGLARYLSEDHLNIYRSVYDLDNIRMADVESRVTAEFELEHLLVEGHCFDASSGSPPRGLEFTLGSPANPVMYDTIVMANLVRISF